MEQDKPPAANAKPVLIFDGDCGFCRIWIDYWRQLTGDAVEYTPYQQASARFPQVSEAEARQAVRLVLPGGQVLAGAAAVARTLRWAPGKEWAHRHYRNVPAAAAVAELCYRVVARHRDAARRATEWFWGVPVLQPSFLVSRWLFLRLLGFVYAAAFFSLLPQIPGLIGDNGILPAAQLLEGVGGVLAAPQRFWYLPTLAWIDAGNGFLQWMCIVGGLCGLLVMAGAATRPALAMCWVLYLSLQSVGQSFLGFQWDILLLEVGFLAMFLAPGGWWRRLADEPQPSSVFLWLYRFLLFRLMFASGLVKLLSGDAAWRSLSALQFHYETQPLPTPLAWYAHQLPAWFHELSAALMFGVELFVPFLFFAPRRLRHAGALITIVVQLLIVATGNYTFFNLLTMALCALLLDDHFWGSRLRPAAWIRIKARLDAGPVVGAALRRPADRDADRDADIGLGVRLTDSGRRALGFFRRAVAALILVLGLIQVGGMVFGALPFPLAGLYGSVAQLRLVNGYGLFAVMTTTRPEIVIEGSNDGSTWLPYVFSYKVQAVDEAPQWVAPHQPRVDWQMWFAALSGPRQQPWIVNLCVRVLEGSPEVLALLRDNPFPGAPPRYVRAQLYNYEFTEWGDASLPETDWWRREYLGVYLEPFSLR